MSDLEQLRSLLARIKLATGPDAELDNEIERTLTAANDEILAAPSPTASEEQALYLCHRLLPGRSVRVGALEGGEFICTVELFGNMPATPPCTVHRAETSPLAILGAMVDALICVELDQWA